MGKGKAIDPRNWGSAQIPEEEMDVEAQRRAFEAYARPHRDEREENMKTHESERPPPARAGHPVEVDMSLREENARL